MAEAPPSGRPLRAGGLGRRGQGWVRVSDGESSPPAIFYLPLSPWPGLASELIPAHLEALTNQIAPVTPPVCHSVLRLPSVSFKSLAVFVFYSCPDLNSPGSSVPSIGLGNAQDRGTSPSRSGAS